MPAFLLTNAALVALALYAGTRPWIADLDSEVARSLTGRWLPFSLAVATALTCLLAAQLSDERRRGVLLRHHLLYLVMPATLLVLRVSARPLNAELGYVYMLFAAALALHGLSALWTALDRLADRRTAILLAATALATYLIVLPYDRTVAPTASDEPHYLLITQSLLYDHDLDLRNDYDGDRYLDFYPTRLPDIHGIIVGSAIYPIRDLGLPIVSVLPYALGGRTGVLVLMCLAGALLVLQLFLLLREIEIDRRVALLAVAVTGLTHPVLTYTTQIYPELLVALGLVTAARLLWAGTSSSARDLALASLVVGTMPWLSTRAWFVAIGTGIVLAAAALLGPGRVRRMPAAAVPFAVLVLALCYVNWRMFGLFIPSAGYYLIRDQQQVLAYAPQVGALGLLFDRDFGLVPRSPVYLLAFVGAIPLFRLARGAGRWEVAALFFAWLLSFVYVANIAYWWADGSPPSRYLLSTIPFLVVAVACGIETIERAARLRPLLRVATWAAVGWTAFVTFVFAVDPGLRYDLAADIRESSNAGALFTFLGRLVRPEPGLAFPSLVRIDVATYLLCAAWLAIVVALVALGRPARTRYP
jgi:hypothetical protein